MTLEEFAKLAGVKIFNYGGGYLAYSEKDHPNVVTHGFKTHNAAINHWMDETFGEHTAKALKKLMEAK